MLLCSVSPKGHRLTGYSGHARPRLLLGASSLAVTVTVVGPARLVVAGPLLLAGALGNTRPVRKIDGTVIGTMTATAAETGTALGALILGQYPLWPRLILSLTVSPK